MGWYMFPSEVPLPMGIWTPSNTWFLDPNKPAPNGILINSAIFVQLTHVQNIHTDTLTDRHL